VKVLEPDIVVLPVKEMPPLPDWIVVTEVPVVEPVVVEWSVALLPIPQVPVPHWTLIAVAPVPLPIVIVLACAPVPKPKVGVDPLVTSIVRLPLSSDQVDVAWPVIVTAELAPALIVTAPVPLPTLVVPVLDWNVASVFVAEIFA
jgi:hypothetical protein